MKREVNVIIVSAFNRSFMKNSVIFVFASFIFVTAFFLLANDHATLYSRNYEIPLNTKNMGLNASHSKQAVVANVSCERLNIDHGCYQVGQNDPRQFMLKKSSDLRRLNCTKRAPAAIVIGTKKSGTTTLKNFLSYHPEVAFADRELKFLNNHKLETLEEYISLMPYSAPYQIPMEKTPGYFIRIIVAKRLKLVLPDVKLIVIIRDPVKRAISDFVHMKFVEDTREGGARQLHRPPKHGQMRYEVSRSFRDSVLYPNSTVKEYNSLIDSGVYVKYFRQWLEYFPLDQFLVLDGEEFVKDPTPTMHKVEHFLGIKPFFTEDHFYFDEQKHFYCLKKPLNTCMSSSKGRPHPEIDNFVTNKLSEYFRPHNIELENLLNRTFPWS